MNAGFSLPVRCPSCCAGGEDQGLLAERIRHAQLPWLRQGGNSRHSCCHSPWHGAEHTQPGAARNDSLCTTPQPAVRLRHLSG